MTDALETQRPDISVLVCTRNRSGALRACVGSILDSRYRNFELLIVDQSDDPETAAYVRSLDDHRIEYRPTETRGLSRARNLALRLARSPLVAFTDDDCICDPGWIGEIIREFKENDDIYGLFGRVRPWGDRWDEGLFCHCLIDDPDERTVAEPVPPHKYLGHGNNMAYRRELFRRVGLYNTQMGAGTRMKSGEDTDLTFRALRQRLPLKYSPAPLVYHDNWNTFAQADRMDLGYVLGFVMVFGKFTLYGDKVARRCLRDRLGELIKDDLRNSFRYKNWPKFRRTWIKLFFYFLGFFPALYFRMKGDLAWTD
ncbi:MAG: glycosyltransferase family 2 protein [Acidobacteria bacterium]|nr:glycosyltransferase family 2 protein [Acidobacteriota bacterium]